MGEFERPNIVNPTKHQIKDFHKAHGMKKRLSDEEIKQVKIDFVRAIMPNRTFESKSEIREQLIKYRDLFAILDDVERGFVNSMIMISQNIPNELVEKEPEEIKETHECPYKCPTCNEQMFNMRTFPRTSYGRNIISDVRSEKGTKRVVEFEMKHLSCPNEFQVICLNRVNYELPYELPVELKNDGKNLGKCPRYGSLLDKEVLSKQ